MTLHRGFSTSVLFGQIPVCLSVRLSVTTLAKASLGSTLRRSYVQHWYRLFSALTRGSSKKPFVQKLWRAKSQYAKEYVLTATSYGADAATFRLNFRRQGLLWFFQSLTVGYMLVRQRATSLSATTAVRVSVSCLQSSAVTFSLTRALCQSLAHAQQR